MAPTSATQLELLDSRDPDFVITPPRDGEIPAIEDDSFPFEEFCAVAELESWRKELHRPIYHIHKWWAQRLGSVFRAILIGTLAPSRIDVRTAFYRPTRFPNAVVFDPFMGSGTTVGEALKLGCRAIGRDINPVAHFAVRNAMRPTVRDEVITKFNEIKNDVEPTISHYYTARLPDGEEVRSLYYFWVAAVECPNCHSDVDLFNSYFFARHTNTVTHPVAQALCPHCGNIDAISYHKSLITCSGCSYRYQPHAGPAKGKNATCPNCYETFEILATMRKYGGKLNYRNYAKLVITPLGQKIYLPTDQFDRDLYNKATTELARLGSDFLVGELTAGYNTSQALNYGFRNWRELFNSRQLLCLRILGDRIRAIPSEELRELFACLFSGTLEFNNMFASYKGEGTGAVRHIFSHHILKPERTPLEANPWGTPKSSGAFCTLFESRILRAIDYCKNPYEIEVDNGNGRTSSRKIYGLSSSIGHPNSDNFREFMSGRPDTTYISCGDSSQTDIPDHSVDAVVTDPPFFDNVHYSELADFFHVWQSYILTFPSKNVPSTRSDREVQQKCVEEFTTRLQGVWTECVRVLKPNGLLVFTYHHSRPEGWYSILEALTAAGLIIVATHPIKSEMSVATPKRQSKEPIDLDIILVCRKRSTYSFERNEDSLLATAIRHSRAQIMRLRGVGRTLSRNDVRVIMMAQLIRTASRDKDPIKTIRPFESKNSQLDDAIDSLHHATVLTGTMNRPR